jgi:hypothetical protein
MRFTILFAILGAVLGAIWHVVANIRLKWLIIGVVAWAVYDNWNDGPTQRQTTNFSQETVTSLKKFVQFSNFTILEEDNGPIALRFDVTNPLQARLSDMWAMCIVPRRNGEMVTLAFSRQRGTVTEVQSTGTVTLEIRERWFNGPDRDEWLDLTTKACEPDFKVNNADLVRAGFIKPLGAQEEIAAHTDVSISGSIRYSKHDPLKGRVIATGAITNSSRFILKGAWVGCSIEGAMPDRDSSNRISFYIPPGKTYPFSLQLSEISLHHYTDRPKGRVYNCRMADFSYEEGAHEGTRVHGQAS